MTSFNIFNTKTYRWVSFDLDDTLHHFRIASSAAMESIYQKISVRYEIQEADIRNAYQAILKNATASAFIEGHNSHFYRSQRFSSLLESLGCHKEECLPELLAIYAQTLQMHLSPTEGAVAILKCLKELEINIAIITEGPTDAQQWTLEQLGFTPFIDRLFTSNQEGVSKKNGLFQKVLEKLNISANEILHIGDSYKDDIEPAIALGISVLWYNPSKNLMLALSNKVKQISKLLEVTEKLDISNYASQILSHAF